MHVIGTFGRCSFKFSTGASDEIRQHLISLDEILVPVLRVESVSIPWGRIAYDRTQQVVTPKTELDGYLVRFVDDTCIVTLYLGAESCGVLSNGRSTFRATFDIEADAMLIRTA